jgi:site-specific DNA-adenine methylase
MDYKKVKPIKAFFGRTGGKHFSKKSILPFIKDLEYDTYIEPFVGAGSIFLGRNKKVKTEIINDYDILVYNLWDGMKDSGNQLKDYKSYFMDKSVFKWYLLKEKQNRRIKKQLKETNIENLKEDIFITTQSRSSNNKNPNTNILKCNCRHSKDKDKDNKIENLKEDLFIHKNSFNKFNEKPNNRVVHKNSCIWYDKDGNVKNNREQLKIENLKEDLYITSKSFSQNNEMIDYDKNIICQCISNENICKCKNKELCLCSKTEKELREYSKKIYKYINLSRTKIFKSFGDTSLDHFFRFSSSQFSLPIKENYEKLTKLYSLDKMEGFLNYPLYIKIFKPSDEDLISTASHKELKIENLKEDLFINKNGRFSDNGSDKPNQKLLNEGCSHLREKQLETNIENLKEDLFISNKSCFSMNKESYDKSLNICNCITSKEKKICKCKNKELCLCSKTEKELLEYSKKIYKSIGKSKKQIEKDMGDRSVEHFFYFNGNQFLIPTKENYEKLTKLYSLDKLDFYLKFPLYSKISNPIKYEDLISSASHKDIKIEIEEKADEDVCVSIEKTKDGLKLIKRKFYVRNKKYKDDETKWRIHNPNLCGWNNILKNCDKYYERLKDVNIFQGDYKKMLKFDSLKSLFYFDPPWTKTSTGKKGNKCYSNYVELDDFYNSIKDLKGFVMISYNNDKEILEKFKNWFIVEISTTYTQKKAGNKKTIDILIMNFKDGKKIN